MTPASSPTAHVPHRRDGIFFVTDPGFALPTAACALAVRRLVAHERADVRILATGMSPAAVERLRATLESSGILVDALPAAMFSDFAQDLFNKTHVPTSALGRFFMLECVPDIYRRVLYLDGDTWPLDDPTILLDAPLPEGAIAAAEDRSFFFASEVGATGDAVRTYLGGLGLDPRAGYFNSGVLLADSGAWRQICAEAFAFFRANTARCTYHDQSALNAVAGGRRVRLSPRWNFAQDFYEWGVTLDPPPRLVHFCGGGKPWALPSHRFHEEIMEAFAAIAALPFAVERPDAGGLRDIERTIARQRLKHRTVLLPRLLARRRTYRRLLATAAIG